MALTYGYGMSRGLWCLVQKSHVSELRLFYFDCGFLLRIGFQRPRWGQKQILFPLFLNAINIFPVKSLAFHLHVLKDHSSRILITLNTWCYLKNRMTEEMSGAKCEKGTVIAIFYVLNLVQKNSLIGKNCSTTS